MPWNDDDYKRMIEHLRQERAKLGDNQRPKKEPKEAKPKPEIAGLTGAALLDKLIAGRKSS